MPPIGTEGVGGGRGKLDDSIEPTCKYVRTWWLPSSLRSALYNWPAKIEHWPADPNGFFTGKTRHSAKYGRVFRAIFDL